MLTTRLQCGTKTTGTFSQSDACNQHHWSPTDVPKQNSHIYQVVQKSPHIEKTNTFNKMYLTLMYRNHFDGWIRKLSQGCNGLGKNTHTTLLSSLLRCSPRREALQTQKFSPTHISWWRYNECGAGCICMESPEKHTKVGCRKQCQQTEYHAHFEKPQMVSIQIQMLQHFCEDPETYIIFQMGSK